MSVNDSVWVLASGHCRSRFVHTPKRDAAQIASARTEYRLASFRASCASDLPSRAVLQASAAQHRATLNGLLAARWAVWDESKYKRTPDGKFTNKSSGSSKSSGGGGATAKSSAPSGPSEKELEEQKKAAEKAAKDAETARKKAAKEAVAAEKEADRDQAEATRAKTARTAEDLKRARFDEDQKIKAAILELAERGEVARGIEAMEKLIERTKAAGDDAGAAELEKDLADMESRAGDFDADEAALDALRARVKESRVVENENIRRAKFEAAEARKAEQERLRKRWAAMTASMTAPSPYIVVAGGDYRGEWADEKPAGCVEMMELPVKGGTVIVLYVPKKKCCDKHGDEGHKHEYHRADDDKAANRYMHGEQQPPAHDGPFDKMFAPAFDVVASLVASMTAQDIQTPDSMTFIDA